MRSLNTAQSPIDITLPPAEVSVLDRIRRASETHFANAPGSHDWEHTMRVNRICRLIGPQKGADMLVLEAAAFLHDIGRSIQDKADGKVCHAVKGAQMATVLLADVPLEARRKENIIHCIRTHRYRDENRPESMEARILFDADKLDAIGAVGIARAYLFAGELKACLHNPYISIENAAPYSKDDTGYREYVVKLSKIKDRMLTSEGRKLAENRHRFMTTFFERFLDEYDGMC